MKLAFLGDIAFFGKYNYDNPDIKEYFLKVSKLLESYDLVIANLEAPLTDSEDKCGCKTIHLKSDTQNIELLKYLNIDIVNLANNHILDYGEKGLSDTVKVLHNNGIDYFGVDSKKSVFEKNGYTFEFAGSCCYSANPYRVIDNATSKRLNMFIPEELEIELNGNNGKSHIKIYSVHFGQEHVNWPNYDHVEIFRKLSESGKYILHGHHPHVLQSIEKINGSILAYSLGNFCFDDIYKDGVKFLEQSENNKSSAIIEVSLENDEFNYKLIPIYLGEKELLLNVDGINEKINDYNESLKLNKVDYQSSRKKKVEKYITTRKSLRTFKWYLDRLNATSVGIILNSKKNSKVYLKKVKKYIEDK